MTDAEFIYARWHEAARSRDAAAPTFAPDGLYFLGPRYAPEWQLPEKTAAFEWLPQAFSRH